VQSLVEIDSADTAKIVYAAAQNIATYLFIKLKQVWIWMT